MDMKHDCGQSEKLSISRIFYLDSSSRKKNQIFIKQLLNIKTKEGTRVEVRKNIKLLSERLFFILRANEIERCQRHAEEIIPHPSGAFVSNYKMPPAVYRKSQWSITSKNFRKNFVKSLEQKNNATNIKERKLILKNGRKDVQTF